MRRLCAFRRKCLVVILLGRIGIERQVELVAPAEFKTGLAKRIVANLGGRVVLGEVGGMGRELVGDDADLHIIAVGQLVMLLRSEEHTSELMSLMRISYAAFCLINNETHVS